MYIMRMLCRVTAHIVKAYYIDILISLFAAFIHEICSFTHQQVGTIICPNKKRLTIYILQYITSKYIFIPFSKVH